MGYRSKHIGQLQIACGNSKIGNIAGLALLPITTCKPGVPCAKCGQCYALKAVKMYKQTRHAWGRNTREAREHPDRRIPQDAIECSGNCESCGMCWSLKDIGKDVVINKH